MPAFLSDSMIASISLGDDAVKQVYLGETPVWSSGITAVAPTVLTLQSVESIFYDVDPTAWASDKKKILVVDSSIGPLNVVNGSETLGGSLTIQVKSTGVVSGLGGAGGTGGAGGAGGAAITVTGISGVDIVNDGIIRGGGGGGGKGGTGGGGQYTTRQPVSGWQPYQINYHSWVYYSNDGHVMIDWNGARVYDAYPGGVTSITVGGWTYLRGNYVDAVYDGYSLARQQTTNTNGGAGGNGGRGLGADGAAANGVAGSAGGTNAGAGGKGGDGSTWGTAGNAGAAGANGNRTNGVAGSGGGAAGAAIAGTGTWNTSGSGTFIGAH